jgi:hypothetical protein
MLRSLLSTRGGSVELLIVELLLVAREQVSDRPGLLSRQEYVWRSWMYSKLPIEVLRLLGHNVPFMMFGSESAADWFS